ncbi:beta-1,3-galactosyltransferase 6 [Leptopilina boulardi]|uniref:beta-1,3-galactosyltransferase 6 n=1 Tax=Leptopilina boulardi TaxID=63433 RepID=UPI0021F51B4A|nr:beta-1,3-galactosyltransferase 6 [Leptopilina boulardi]
MILRRTYIKINIISLIIIISFLLISVHFISTFMCSSKEQNTSKYNKSKYRLIVLVLSGVDHLEQRDTIRKTWLSEKYNDVRYLFAVGTLNIHQSQRITLQSEKQKFNDLLLLPNLQDTYGTITKKILQSFFHIHKEYDFDFILKCDDDSFVIIHRILRELDRWESEGRKKFLYWGFFNGKAQVKRNGPWKETEWILCDNYLPYALGGGYILSYKLVEFIAKNAENLKLYNSEDVSVGLWLAPVANIERRHDVRFDTEYRSRGCSNQYLITHKQTIDNMRSLHELYQSNGILCSKEIQRRMSYQYNWTVPPSQCCNRQSGIP